MIYSCFTVQSHVVIFESVQVQMWYNGYHCVAFGGGREVVFTIFLKKAKVCKSMVFREQICHGKVSPERQAGSWGPG